VCRLSACLRVPTLLFVLCEQLPFQIRFKVCIQIVLDSSPVQEQYRMSGSSLKTKTFSERGCLIECLPSVTHTIKSERLIYFSQVDAMLIDQDLAAVPVVPAPVSEARSHVCLVGCCPWQDIQMGGPQFEVIIVSQHLNLDINVCSLPQLHQRLTHPVPDGASNDEVSEFLSYPFILSHIFAWLLFYTLPRSLALSLASHLFLCPDAR
jgi:hypothetical protein